MSDTRVLFARHGRVLLPLLAAYIVLCIAGVAMRENDQAQMIFSIVSMLFSVGVTFYALDYPIRFFASGEDRLFHLSPASRFVTSLRAVFVLVVYLMGFFIIGRSAQLLILEASPTIWAWGLGGALTQKLASLLCAFSLVLVASALAKPLRGGIALRATIWIGFCVAVVACAGVFIGWLSQPERMVSWAIGTVGGVNISVYAGLVPVLVPEASLSGMVAWIWCVSDVVIAMTCFVAFFGLCRWRRMNFLTV